MKSTFQNASDEGTVRMTVGVRLAQGKNLTSSLQQLPTPVFAPAGNYLQEQIRLLMLEHSTSDALPIVRALEQSGLGIQSARAACPESFRAALQTFEPDVVFTVGVVNHHDARAALEILREVRPTAPMIVVADSLTGPQTVAMVHAGAADVVLKHDLAELPGVLRRVLDVRRDARKLTARQIEVLQLVAAGLRTREIADRLGVSIKTIETHRGEIMKRLCVHDVVGLARYAIRVGLVPWC